jgi:hypothetical protein
MKRCIRTDCRVKDRDSRLNSKNKMKQEAGVAQSRKRKTIQLVSMDAVHELDDVSSNEDSSQRSRQTGSTNGSSISS